ncbi:MAG: peptidoglycan DD-metalloendopeptidase family protein [Chloroflexi bacterium]|nr:peptidoglycan DD-metalloendopeptidase family protein [Chloroflexota bacterium]
MPLQVEQITRRLRGAWWWSRTVAGPWLGDRRRAVSHVALLTVAVGAIGAGVVGVERRTGSPGDLAYLTPPDPSSDESLRLRTDTATGAEGQTPETSAVADSTPVAYRTHEVQPGDTLYGIAEQYGVDAQYLLWNNPELTINPDLLIIGARVLVPGVNGIVYDVRLGDTINAIAATYDIDPGDVVSFAPNELASADFIIEGSVLVLPGGVPPPPPVLPEPLDPPALGPVPAGIGSTTGSAFTSVSFIWPLNGTLWGGFGPRWGSFHRGIDVGANAGTAVAAAASGQVVLSTYSDNGYGSYVIVQHADGSQTLYAHLLERYVVLGQNVGQGEVIGAVGCSGWCNGNHLHFEVIIGGGVVNPLAYLP